MADDLNEKKKKEVFRAVKFVLFSVSAGIVEIIVYSLMELLTDLPYWPCYLTALICSVLWNFTLNRHFTFQSANNVPVAMMKVAAYYCVFTPVTTIGGNYLAEDLGWNGFLVTGINMACNLVTEYLYDRFFVFGKTIDTNKRARRIEREEKEAEAAAKKEEMKACSAAAAKEDMKECSAATAKEAESAEEER